MGISALIATPPAAGSEALIARLVFGVYNGRLSTTARTKALIARLVCLVDYGRGSTAARTEALVSWVTLALQTVISKRVHTIVRSMGDFAGLLGHFG